MFLSRCRCCEDVFLVDGGAIERGWHCPNSGQFIRMLPQKAFTEADWLTWSEPNVLLPYFSRKARKRKRRLLLCAYCRSIWELLTEDWQRELVVSAEKYADGLVDIGKLQAAERRLLRARSSWRDDATTELAAGTLLRAVASDPWCHSEATERNQQQVHCALLRDVVGNPFRQVTLGRAVLRWNDGTLPRIAEGIYEERAFDRLPILHDALLDAGCDDESILSHCRVPGPHVRGCWVIDLILGKE